MSETLTNLRTYVRENKCSKCPPWAFTQACSVGLENKKVLWK